MVATSNCGKRKEASALTRKAGTWVVTNRSPAIAAAAVGAALAFVFNGCGGGQHEGPGTLSNRRIPVAAVRQRGQRQASSKDIATEGVAGIGQRTAAKQILFGDLHVHTTFSMDAFALSLPLRGGEGAHPPADACDFARYCAALDFFSINDHAESITPRHWQETKESIRTCNDVAGDSSNPDLVAFLGWEWTQVGTDPANHYGHKNVVFLETAEDKVPTRPISAVRPDFRRLPIPTWARYAMPLMDFSHRQRYRDFFHFLDEIAAVPACPDDVDSRSLPADCHEAVGTPRELFTRLDQWETPSIVIPHGTTWGLNTPPGTELAQQLGKDHDPMRQTLFEIYSGHGGAEEYRSWRAIERAAGAHSCPSPSADYEPCCWRAGEIIRSRCDNPQSDQCNERVRNARLNYVRAGVAGHRTVPGASVEDWLDCGQCRDCFLPAFDYRPGMSAQIALAESRNGGSGDEDRFRFAFIGSSDTHSARAGKGYKETQRGLMIDAGLGSRFGASWRGKEERAPDSRAVNIRDLPLDQRRFGERGVSFLVGGGLVAVHSSGRDRASIWQALQKREVYATSGPRILLWFHLLNSNQGTAAMGADVRSTETPRFRVSASGSLRQKAGCPEEVRGLFSAERIARLCGDECYNPTDERYRIRRIEIIRIRPRIAADENLRSLIDDPWKVHTCSDDPEGCTFTFEDPDFAHAGREFVYYARALQEPTLAINAANLRCQYDQGKCVEVNPCYSDDRTPADDDCLAETMERAWSSPIFVRPAAEASPSTRP